MKAIIQKGYGSIDNLKYENVPKPEPAFKEVLVKVIASSVNYGNLAILKGKPLLARFWSGFFNLKFTIPGGDVAGIVESVGKRVKQFKSGDAVYGDLSGHHFGAFAEYVCVPEHVLALKPTNVSFVEAAAAAQASIVALQGLRDNGKIRNGMKVLIYGASGGIGTFGVQIAKYYGAEVTGVCGTENIELVRSIGADYVIDYRKEDFTKSGKLYDLIVATAGYRSILDYKRALGPGGRYVATGGSMAQIFQALLAGPLISLFGNKKMGNLLHRIKQEDLFVMKEMIETGKVKPVVDRCFPLHEISAAIDYYAKGHSRGKVAIAVSEIN